jgi:HEAT repeat protein
MRRVAPALALLALLTAVAGCRGRGAREAPSLCGPIALGDDRPYRTGGEHEERLLREAIGRLATASGEEAAATGRAVVSRGESAVPPLLDALRSPDARLRGAAAYLLGVLKDRRTLPALATASSDAVPAVRYEAAAAMLEMQDARGFAVLVAGLEDADARLRGKCIEVLEEKAGTTLGFEADGAPADRAAAVQRWRAWLDARAAAPDAAPR